MTEMHHMDTTTQWVVPFDGSEHAIRALALAINEAKERHTQPKLLVLNVQLPLSADVSRFIDGKTIDDFHREAGEKALASSKDLLDASGVAHTLHILVGPVAHTIASFAATQDCSMIIMGTRGHTSVTGLIMGSVTTRLLHETTLPVLLTK